jgi:2-polyprenyl-6-methoxyphenol hydroxylase-like FAD-dependent oxidoreductase
MSKIIVVGAGVCGLSAGLLLARDGHDVTLLERDPQPVPDSPQQGWEDWSREGVVQFRQPHYLQPAGHTVLEQELPDVVQELTAAGAMPFTPLSLLPPSISDREPWPGDERFRTLLARRPVLEQVLGLAAESQPRLQVSRGVDVTGLTTRMYNGIAHVTGVRSDRGEQLDGDVVVDAMGRRSRMGRWLADVGAAPVHEEAEDSGFLYYTRFFRSTAPGMPQFRGPPLTPLGSFSILIIPSDNDTWSVTLYTSSGDRPLKRLRERERWEAVLRACPLHVHWLDGEPISEVAPIGGIVDRYRRLVVNGEPIVTGVVLLADSWACTNPSLGRGMALGLLHARHLRDLAHDGVDDPRRFAANWDALTEAHLTPWYRDTVTEDRARLREIEALRVAAAPPPPEDLAARLRALLPAAAVHDAGLFRAFLTARGCITPVGEVLAQPGIADRTLAIAREHEAPAIPGPDRDQLLALLS